MPTKREREYYAMGYRDGVRGAEATMGRPYPPAPSLIEQEEAIQYSPLVRGRRIEKRKRKLSAWNKFVKANAKKPRFRYRNGKLNLKKMAIAFRKTPAGRKKRR